MGFLHPEPLLPDAKSATELINDVWAIRVLKETKQSLRGNDMITKVPQ